MFCSSCGIELSNDCRFCTQCGKPTGTSIVANDSFNQSSSGEKVQSKIFSLTSEQAQIVIQKTENWLKLEKDFEVQKINDQSMELLQIRKIGTWRRFVGMSTALSIKFVKSEDSLEVEIGQGHWLGKVATGGTSMFILWPLLVSTAYGVFDQIKTPKKIFDFIEWKVSEINYSK